MPAILCFGDSNTWGWHENGRFARDVRWPGVLRSLVPAGWDVIEEGLSGRRAADSLAYFEPCLQSHLPLDVVVLFLGINDPTAEEAVAGIRALAGHALAAGVPRVLVLAPPARGLGAAYRGLCAELGVELLDLDGVAAFRPDDPIHFDPAAQRAIGQAVADKIKIVEKI
jgi:lysophospholipase L1-like esterase